jgi:hypothetical protein
MSINACSINEHTINTLCGRRRQAIIDMLLPPIVVTGGGQQQHVHPDTKVNLNIFRRQESHEDNTVDIKTLELPWITVTIEAGGQTFTQTLDRDEIVPLVNIFGLSVKGNGEESVNIFDITIRIL